MRGQRATLPVEPEASSRLCYRDSAGSGSLSHPATTGSPWIPFLQAHAPHKDRLHAGSLLQ